MVVYTTLYIDVDLRMISNMFKNVFPYCKKHAHDYLPVMQCQKCKAKRSRPATLQQWFLHGSHTSGKFRNKQEVVSADVGAGQKNNGHYKGQHNRVWEAEEWRDCAVRLWRGVGGPRWHARHCVRNNHHSLSDWRACWKITGTCAERLIPNPERLQTYRTRHTLTWEDAWCTYRKIIILSSFTLQPFLLWNMRRVHKNTKMLFKIFFCGRTNVIQVWNDLRENKWWRTHFQVRKASVCAVVERTYPSSCAASGICESFDRLLAYSSSILILSA